MQHLHFLGRPKGNLNPTKVSFGESNPAPLLLENGTVLLLTRGKDAYVKNATNSKLHNIWLWKADTWNSTYELQLLNGPNGAVNISNTIRSTEDPVLWKGRRGYHVLFHSSPQLTHGWSKDALHWFWSENLIGPEVTPGGGDHERPRVVLDVDGDVDTLFVSTLVNAAENDASALLAYPVG